MAKAFRVGGLVSAVITAAFFLGGGVEAAPPPPGFPTPPQFPQSPQFPAPPVPPPFPSPAPPFPAPFPPVAPTRLPDFGVTVLADGLPTPGHLKQKGPLLFWSQAGDNPVQKMTTNGGEPEAVAMKMGVPENILAAGKYVYWIDGTKLKATDIGEGTTTVVSEGTKNFGESAMAADGKYLYWVNSKASPSSWTINRVSMSGGKSSVIGSSTKPIVALLFDNGYVYWEESGAVPKKVMGESAIRKVPAAGGPVVTVVDGGLNGLTPSSNWQPAGGMAITGGGLYFSRTNYMKEADKVFRVPTEGGAVAPVGEVVQGPVVKMAADKENVYWADAASIERLPIGGGKAMELAGGLRSPADLAVGGSEVYWTETICCGHGQKGSIKKAPIAGGKITELARNVDAPGPIAVSGADVLWGEGGPAGLAEGFGRIAKVSGDGQITTVAGGISSDRPPIAVDDLNVYVADKFTIKKIPLSGGQAEKIASAEFTVVDLAANNSNVYWIEDPVSTVRRVDVSGGPVTTITSGTGPAGRLTIDGSSIYWVDHYDTIRKVGLMSRFESVIASNLQYVTDIAVDSGTLYFLESNGRDIRSITTSGGAAIRLVSFINPPGSIAVDRTNLYWADQGGVGEVSRKGGSPTVVATELASDPRMPNSIAADGINIYWTEAAGGVIKRAGR
jgi:hypothetical protein